jgi:hypothetical protein
MMEERALLILGQQEHEQLLDDEIAQLKGLLQAKEKELQRLTSVLKAVPHQQSGSRDQQVDIVERLESLEHEIVQLKRRTPTLADAKCVAAAFRQQPRVSHAPAGTNLCLRSDRAVAAQEMWRWRRWQLLVTE